MTPSTAEMRIGSDVAYQFTALGGTDEVRIWNVARTKDQIRSTLLTTISTPTTGLVAVYAMDGNATDSVGGHHGTTNGTMTFASPTAGTCVASTTVLCFENRFAVSAAWAANNQTGVGTVVPGASANSGLFWFFAPDNWELLVKELSGCSLNSKRWVFSAATTNVHYNLTVIDYATGAQRHYINYQGISAPAVTDVDAFATCP
jgi:hypothetical protein